MSDTGIIFIISAPSGGGKTSISKKLVQDNTNLWLSISSTTRPQRSGEVDRVDYYFIDNSTYKTMQEQSQFLESAKVYDYYYGTPKQPVEDKLNQGLDVLFDIDWQGARSIKESSEFPLVSIFILPPSLPALQERLLARGDDVGVIKKRMLKAKEECSHCVEYDYIVVNDSFDDTIATIAKIMQVSKIKFQKQKIKELMASKDFMV